MRKIAKGLIVVGAMLAAGTAAAEIMDDVKPYAGVDYYHAWMKGLQGKNPNLNTYDTAKYVPKSYPGAVVYAGAKFMDSMGVEIGADWSARKSKTVNETQRINGADTKLQIKTQVKRRGMHVDLVGFLPLNEYFDLLGFVGVGWVKPKVSTTVTGVDTGRSLTIDSKIKAKALPRLGLGASYMVTDMIGLRAKVGWENTRRLKAAANILHTEGAFFKDTVSLSVGAFVRF